MGQSLFKVLGILCFAESLGPNVIYLLVKEKD